tara:strand:+ start:409 stop:636 length:228 start_codon:yes stop_codon:yes gene_type:complete
MYNTWDYKVGDLIQVEKLGRPPEIGVVTLFHEKGLDAPRSYWKWVSASTGRMMFFYEIKAYTLGMDHKVKRLARA